MIKSLLRYLVFVSFVVVSLATHSQDRIDRKTLVVGVLSDFPPHYQLNAAGEPDGFAVETFDQIARRAGINYRYRIVNDWNAMLTALRIGEIDIIPNLGITPERVRDLDFTRPLEEFELGLFVNSTDKNIAGIEGMKGKTVAVVERNAGVKYIAQFPDIEKRIYKYAEEALFALLAGDIDGFIYPVPIVKELAKRNQVEKQIVRSGPALMQIERAMAVHKGRTELYERLQQAVNLFLNNGDYNDIRQRWLSNNQSVRDFSDTQTMSADRKLRLGIITGLVVLSLLLWMVRHSEPVRHWLPPSDLKLGLLMSIFIIVLAAVVFFYPQQAGQKVERPPRISIIHLSKVDASTYAGFLVQMKELGYLQGNNIEYNYNGPAHSIDRLEPLIQSHLKMQPDLILVSSTPGTLAVKHLTKDMNIPVVFAPVNDPVDAGILTNLKHPGGFITGVRLPTGDDLRLQWLQRLAPQAKKIYVPFTKGDKSALATIEQIKTTASQLNLELIIRAINASDSIMGPDSVLPNVIDAVFLPRDSTVEARIDEFVQLAKARKLPLCVPSTKQVYAGALFSYGFVHFEIGRQSAQLVDQILRGTHPSGLPVVMAENQMLINTQIAQEIELNIPAEILLQANKVIRE